MAYTDPELETSGQCQNQTVDKLFGKTCAEQNAKRPHVRFFYDGYPASRLLCVRPASKSEPYYQTGDYLVHSMKSQTFRNEARFDMIQNSDICKEYINKLRSVSTHEC